jgi:transcriptional regulator with XRE-family HTH domain
MDHVRLGSALRSIRLELRLRQIDVAGRAGVCQQTVSSVEAGRWSRLSVEALEAVADALGAQLQVGIRWRGPGLARLLDRRHARLQDLVAQWLVAEGWEVRVEESFSHFGERGSVDIIAWRADVGALLVVEIKSEIVDMQDTLRSLDAKARLMPVLARRDRGWDARHVGVLLVLPEASIHRKVVAGHAAMSIALPARNVAVRRWLREPAGDMRGIWFFHNTSPDGAIARDRPTRRIRRAFDAARSGATPGGRQV